MAQPEVRYFGDDITCYPSSNATDNGKLQLEYNMARLVTRVTSKNFCIIKPSFVLTATNDATTNTPKIKVSVGQASINGMDLIMSNTIEIDPPTSSGYYHLAFKLARDEGNNVLGDYIEGVTRTFEGVVLSWYAEKPEPMDPDMLYLGQVYWNGTRFTSVVEDEDKYGRIWAEDVLGKFLDPKHPDIRRMTLQEFIYKIPDWYVSKEGDTIYGPLSLVDSRSSKKVGIIANVDADGSHITLKAPSTDNIKVQLYGDLNRDGVVDQSDADMVLNYTKGTYSLTALQKILADVNHDGVVDQDDYQYILNYIQGKGNPGDTGNIYYIDNTNNGINFDISSTQSKMELGKGSIYQNTSDGILHIKNAGNINIDAEGELSLQGDNKITISTENSNSPVLTMTNDVFKITSPLSSNNVFEISIPDAINILQTVGKAVWLYNSNNKSLTLQSDNLNNLNILVDTSFSKNVRVNSTLSLGQSDSLPQTTLTRTSWWLRESKANGRTANFTPQTITLMNPAGDGTSTIIVKNSDDSKHTVLYDLGKIELKTTASDGPGIRFTDGTANNNAAIYKVKGSKKIQVDGTLGVNSNVYADGSVTGASGVTVGNGVLTFNRTSGSATISKDDTGSNLRTSSNLYVGGSGTANLYAGATQLKGQTKIGSAGQCVISDSGNINTSGTITGSKVYNAVYNDIAEFIEKSDYEEEIEAGDVICLDEDGKAKRVTSRDDMKTIIGIASSDATYGFALGGDGLEEKQKVAVGLKGRIPVKVTDPYLEMGEVLVAKEDGTAGRLTPDMIYNIPLGKVAGKYEDGKILVWLI